jgi:hypothetical protein
MQTVNLLSATKLYTSVLLKHCAIFELSVVLASGSNSLPHTDYLDRNDRSGRCSIWTSCEARETYCETEWQPCSAHDPICEAAWFLFLSALNPLTEIDNKSTVSGISLAIWGYIPSIFSNIYMWLMNANDFGCKMCQYCPVWKIE